MVPAVIALSICLLSTTVTVAQNDALDNFRRLEGFCKQSELLLDHSCLTQPAKCSHMTASQGCAALCNHYGLCEGFLYNSSAPLECSLHKNILANCFEKQPYDNADMDYYIKLHLYSDPCLSVRCENGGVCLIITGQATCQCPAPFIGQFCQLLDPCLMSIDGLPCLNGATCRVDNRTLDGYMCLCPAHTYGLKCEHQYLPRNEVNQAGYAEIIQKGTARYLSWQLNETEFRGHTIISIQVDLPDGTSGYVTNSSNLVHNEVDGMYPWQQFYIRLPTLPDHTNLRLQVVLLKANFQVERLLDTKLVLEPNDPCKHLKCAHGSCTISPDGQAYCYCSYGYTGALCDRPTHQLQSTGTGTYGCTSSKEDPCKTVAVDFCLNGGSCHSNDVGEPYCLCPTEYWGEKCQFDMCKTTNLCKNGATCSLLPNSTDVNCTCAPSYTGTFCEAKTSDEPTKLCDETSSFCLNGGTCRHNDIGEPFCVCPPERWGDKCQLDLCKTFSPCQNNGICTVIAGTTNVTCDCLEPFGGQFCEIDLTPRVSACDYLNYCLSGGTCTENDIGTPVCICTIGRSGDRCEFDACHTHDPCQNGGTCHAISGTHQVQCSCPTKYTGKFCEARVESCSEDKCLGGICHELYSWGYLCHCTDGSKIMNGPCPASRCARWPYPCSEGICHDSSNVSEAYLCSCPDGSVGKNCQQKEANPCLGDVCGRDGECLLAEAGYYCYCSDGSFRVNDSCPVSKCRQSNRCGNGICVEAANTPEGYVCQCPDKSYGLDCFKRVHVPFTCTFVSNDCEIEAGNMSHWQISDGFLYYIPSENDSNANKPAEENFTKIEENTATLRIDEKSLPPQTCLSFLIWAYDEGFSVLIEPDNSTLGLRQVFKTTSSAKRFLGTRIAITLYGLYKALVFHSKTTFSQIALAKLSIENGKCFEDPCKRANCGQHGRCVATGKNYICHCPDGSLRSNGSCPISQCLYRNPCGTGQCYDLPGTSNGYVCRCKDGSLDVSCQINGIPPLFCNFETNICGMALEKSQAGWKRNTCATEKLISKTGPAASTRQYYLYFDSKNKPKGHVEDAEIKLTTNDTNGQFCLSFRYHMYTTYELGDTVLSVWKRYDNLTDDQIFKRRGNQGNDWHVALLNIEGPVQSVGFRAERGVNISDIAVTNVSLVEGECPGCPYEVNMGNSNCSDVTLLNIEWPEQCLLEGDCYEDHCPHCTWFFDRDWEAFKKGFSIDDGRQYWLGLENAFLLTETGNYDLVIEVQHNETFYGYDPNQQRSPKGQPQEQGVFRARYFGFSIGGESRGYRINWLQFDNSSLSTMGNAMMVHRGSHFGKENVYFKTGFWQSTDSSRDLMVTGVYKDYWNDRYNKRFTVKRMSMTLIKIDV